MILSQAINQQTKNKLFVSLAAKPGRTGETFYNALFKHHNIDAEYVACECIDLANDLAIAKSACAGISITMPYKTQLIPYIDNWQCDIGIANTIKVEQGALIAYNSDLSGLRDTLTDQLHEKIITLLGDGAMAQNIIKIANTATIKQYSRRLDNWDDRHGVTDVLINATSIGMNIDESPVDQVNAGLVIDCVIGKTKLTKLSTNYISGAEIYLAQFKHQFEIYTGIPPNTEVVATIAKELFYD
jgi:shikimate 5-dehydrogenase